MEYIAVFFFIASAYLIYRIGFYRTANNILASWVETMLPEYEKYLLNDPALDELDSKVRLVSVREVRKLLRKPGKDLT